MVWRVRALECRRSAETDKTSVLGGEITIMKNVVVLAIFLAATYAPSAFATAELKLTTGASTVTIVDGAATDTCGTSDCVTFNGALGSWKVNVTTGLEDGVPFFDL